MIEFDKIIDRCTEYYDHKIRRTIYKGNVIDYDNLLNLSRILKNDPKKGDACTLPVLFKLLDLYDQGRNINDAVEQLDLYSSHEKFLLDEGICKVVDQHITYELPNFNEEERENDPLNLIGFQFPPLIEIIDHEKFKKLSRAVYVSFFFFVFEIKKQNVIRSLFDEMSHKGPIAEQKIREMLELNKSKVELVADKSSRQKKGSAEDVPKVIDHVTFFSKKLKGIRSKLEGDSLLEFESVVSELKRLKLIEKGTPTEQFLDVFTLKKIKSNRKINWTGSPKDLRFFAETIAKSNIAESLTGLEKWYACVHCFNISLRGQQMGSIESYKSIAYAKISNKDKTEDLEKILNKLVEKCNDLY